MRSRWLFPALLVTAVAGAACASHVPGGEEVGAGAQRIIGGGADATMAVVAVVRPSNGTLCSGTLVAPDVVLTAAHCVYGVDPADLEVLVGASVAAPDQTVAVARAVAYPTYTGESTGLSGGVDLGAVYLASPLSVAPVAIRADATDAELAGASVTLVGYGVSTTSDTSTAGTRRSAATTVSGVCSRILTLGNADANECSGDSGGAVLLGGALVAVISAGNLDCIAPSSQTRIGAHALWIDAVLHGGDAGACPECVEPDPSCDAPVEGAGASGDGGSVDASGGDGGGRAGAGGGGGACGIGSLRVADDDGALVTLATFGIIAAAARSRRRQRPARRTSA